MATFDPTDLEEGYAFLLECCDIAQLQAILADPREQARLFSYVADRDARLRNWFSALRDGNYLICSQIDRRYNCIAWSLGQVDRFWWPRAQHYWPTDPPPPDTIETFVQLYRSFGYEECSDRGIEPGYAKVALYAKNGDPTHAARQLSTGLWTSKLGVWEDIEHALEGLEGNGESEYGYVVRVFRKPTPKPAGVGSGP